MHDLQYDILFLRLYSTGKYRYVKVIRVATYFKDILREEALRFS